jgi:hypothetical protein
MTFTVDGLSKHIAYILSKNSLCEFANDTNILYVNVDDMYEFFKTVFNVHLNKDLTPYDCERLYELLHYYLENHQQLLYEIEKFRDTSDFDGFFQLLTGNRRLQMPILPKLYELLNVFEICWRNKLHMRY